MQGDILALTPKLREIFGSGHDFYDPKYLAFIVTTQNCDLVRRQNGKCDADYINLAGVMTLHTILPSLFDIVCERVCENGLVGAYLKSSYPEAVRLVEHIINQNAWKIGLFYLHNDVGAGIDEPAVALLRICANVRLTKKNYRILTKARRGRLSDLFQAKLGWTVGNLYSRIGTPDWGDINEKDIKIKVKLIEDFLDPSEYKWIPNSWIREARKKGVEFEKLSLDSVMQELEQYKPTPFYKDVVRHFKNLLNKHFPQINTDELSEFEKILHEDLFIKDIKSRRELKS